MKHTKQHNMTLVTVEDTDDECPQFDGGYVYYECNKCNYRTRIEEYGFGKGSKEEAISRLPKPRH